MTGRNVVAGILTSKLLWAVVISVVTVVVILDLVVFPLPVELLRRPQSRFVYSADGQLLSCFASEDEYWRLSTPLDSISPRLITTVLACEDRWFRYHPGVNPVSLVSALVDNLSAGRVVRGGSTITMQIARMIEPKPRTLGSKIKEIARAMQLEIRYNKDELLQIYFDLVPYGGNIEGVGAASHFYFDKHPSRLSWSEAAILAAIPVAPDRYRPDLRPSACQQRRDRILTGLQDLKILDSSAAAQAREEPIPTHGTERPLVAPHFCQWLNQLYPDSATLRTTIKLEIQHLCQRLASRAVERLRPQGIHNLAVVVLDNRKGELLAMIGSPKFEDSLHQGQVNGATALRSPGSALKPFVYALGFDLGHITPASRLDDIPVSFAGYRPENYDESFHGAVRADDALIQSLNVPVVNLVKKVGLDTLHNLLIRGGVSSLSRPTYEYGLPLVLGSGEVSLLELSNLYATLARGGLFRSVSLTQDDVSDSETRILSAESCFIIGEILSQLNRPNLNTSWEFTRNQPRVAWKTGTSYGRRDAWTVGHNPSFTVGVWVGNFSGEASPYLVGAEVAAPIMFEVFGALCESRPPEWFDRPVGAETREVCAASGHPPNDCCPVTTADWYLPDKSPVYRCEVHHKIVVDRASGYSVCKACNTGLDSDTMLIEQWPARLTAWMLDKDLVMDPPEHNPLCRGALSAEAPVITSPEPDGVYFIRSEAPLENQQMLFQASLAFSSKVVHWFLDDRLFASGPADHRFFYSPRPGRHRLLCVDEFGRSSEIIFSVHTGSQSPP